MTESREVPLSTIEEGKEPRVFVKALLPAAAFVGGFAWDALTLGRQIKSTDLAILVAYFVAAGAILLMIGRRVEFRGSSRLNLALQFLFGSMFSALVILYFLSSGDALRFVTVLVLAGLLVANEFLGTRYDRLTISWVMFGICGIMLLNFVLPQVMRSMNAGWFYASLGVATLLVLGMRGLSRDAEAAVWPTIACASVLALLYAVNLIPPVPLVARAIVVATDVKRDGNDFIVRGRTTPGIGVFRTKTLMKEPNGAVYCFTSIFAPPGIETSVTHRWMRRDARTGEWETVDRITFSLIGGRTGGYRGYSVKQNVTDGEWKVYAETPSGSVIGSTSFRVSSGSAGDTRDFERRF